MFFTGIKPYDFSKRLGNKRFLPLEKGQGRWIFYII